MSPFVYVVAHSSLEKKNCWNIDYTIANFIIKIPQTVSLAQLGERQTEVFGH